MLHDIFLDGLLSKFISVNVEESDDRLDLVGQNEGAQLWCLVVVSTTQELVSLLSNVLINLSEKPSSVIIAI
jgi:hypothetical protein